MKLKDWRFWVYYHSETQVWKCEGSCLTMRKIILVEGDAADSAIHLCQKAILGFLVSLPKDSE